MSAPRERLVDVDGVHVHVREVGAGPAVLLINGLGAHTGLWGSLERSLDGFRLIEFDAPGAGRSPAPPLPISVARLARIAAGVLDAAGAERADVLGYSMGGIIAQQLAVDAPERVNRLVLVATTCGLGSIQGDPLAILNVAVPVRYLSPWFYARTIGGLAGGRARDDREWVARIAQARFRQLPSARGYIGQVLSLSGWSGLRLLPRIGHPTLVVTGDDDPLTPVANAMLLARLIPEARMLVAPGEGHLLLLDARNPILGSIREFLEGEHLDGIASWRDATAVDDEDLDAAIDAVRWQAQPWGCIGAIMRRRFLSQLRR